MPSHVNDQVVITYESQSTLTTQVGSFMQRVLLCHNLLVAVSFHVRSKVLFGREGFEADFAEFLVIGILLHVLSFHMLLQLIFLEKSLATFSNVTEKRL